MLKGFGLSHQEEQGFRILGILLLVLIGVRIFVEWYEIPLTLPDSRKSMILESLSSGTSQTTAFGTSPSKKEENKLPGMIISPPGKTYRPREKTELNQADSADLIKLIGIGPVFAKRIIAYRQKLGGYHSTEQLREIFGMADTTFHLLADQITLNASLIRHIDLNQAPYEQLADHPYLKPREVRNIMYYRGKYKQFNSPDEIVQNHLMDSLRFRKLRPYLRVQPPSPEAAQNP